MSAGHCVTANVSYVVAGDYNLDVNEMSEQKRFIYGYYYFNGYYYSDANNYDIVAIKITEPFILNNYVKTVAMADLNTTPSGYGVLFGWGLPGNSVTWTDRILSSVDVPILSYDDCQRMYPSINETHLCAGYLNGTPTMCSGDSGSPLVQLDDNYKLMLVGIAMEGPSRCDMVGLTPIYADVGMFREWILEKIEKVEEIIRKSKQLSFRVTSW